MKRKSIIGALAVLAILMLSSFAFVTWYDCKACDGKGWSLTRNCSTCNGRKVKTEIVNCSRCSGTGYIKDRYGDNQRCPQCDGAKKELREYTCPTCNGSGEEKMPCRVCNGKGKVWKDD